MERTSWTFLSARRWSKRIDDILDYLKDVKEGVEQSMYVSISVFFSNAFHFVQTEPVVGFRYFS